MIENWVEDVYRRRDANLLTILKKWIELRRNILSGETHEMHLLYLEMEEVLKGKTPANETMVTKTEMQEAFNEHIRDSWGWTEFAKMHTASSGAEYKRAFLAGYVIGRDKGYELGVHSQGEQDGTGSKGA